MFVIQLLLFLCETVIKSSKTDKQTKLSSRTPKDWYQKAWLHSQAQAWLCRIMEQVLYDDWIKKPREK